MVPEGVIGDFHEQQLGEGKYPITYLYPIHMIMHFLTLHN
jgi:hypothetical protein